MADPIFTPRLSDLYDVPPSYGDLSSDLGPLFDKTGVLGTTVSTTDITGTAADLGELDPSTEADELEEAAAWDEGDDDPPDPVTEADPSVLPFGDSPVASRTLALTLQALSDLELNIGGADGVTLVVNPGPFQVALDLSPAGAKISATLALAVRFSASLLQPMRAVGSGTDLQFVPDTSVTAVELKLASVTLTVDIDGTFDLQTSAGISLSQPVMVGTTGVIIESATLSFNLNGKGDKPDGAPDGWKGVLIKQATVRIPSITSAAISADKLGFGSGGVTGEISVTFPATLTDKVLGMTGGLTTVGLTLRENIPTAVLIGAKVLLPFFDFPNPVEIDISLGIDGTVTATLSGGTSLVSLDRPGLAKFDLKALTVGVEDGEVFTALSGALTPEVAAEGGLTWPTFDIKELRIDSSGHVSLSGGWVDLPSQKTFSLYGFTAEISKIGFGTQDDGQRWIGFSGGLTLVSGIKAGASVKGLRIIFGEDLTAAPSLSLDGVGIDFEIPGSLKVTGSVSLTGQDFAGAVKVTIEPITLTIDGQFVTGKNPTTGNHYFGIFLQGDLPTGIALGSTGLAIYGIAGLYGQGLAPNKAPTEDWYENPDGTPGWYKRNPVGITSLADKWLPPTDGAYAFGAGVTLGTYADNGYEFSGSLLLVLTFPGPTILIDGRANLFKKRAALSGSDPTFRALAVIQPNVSFLLGLDAHYKYKDSGELVDIKGSAEAFFDFQDPDDWHIYLGRKDPKLNARIAAKLFKLFDVNGYFELTPQQLAMGAAFSFDKKYGFSSLNVHVQASMQTDATVSWHPSHFNGDLILDGSAQLQAFGHGVGVKAHADITGDVFEPVHLHGDFSVGIDLPWPLPDIGASISLDWKTPLDQPPVLPLPLHDATIEHGTRMLKWPIPRDPNNGALLPDLDVNKTLEFVGNGTLPTTPDDEHAPPTAAPRVPADSKVGLTFSRPIDDVAQIGVTSTSVLPEFVGDPTATTTGDPPTAATQQNPPTAASQQNPKSAYSVYYQLSSVTLEKRVPAPGTANPSDLTPRWVQIAAAQGATQPDGVTQLFGAWAGVHPNTSDPASNNEQLKLLVNAKTPYDYTSQQLQVYDTWFDNNTPGYPCQPLKSPDQKFCALFVDFQFILPDAKQINFTNPAFSVIWPFKAELPDGDTDVPGGNGSRRALGTVGTLDPDNAVQVIPPPGLNEVDIMVGTANGIIDIVTVTPTQNMVTGNVLSLDTADLAIFDTDDPNADLNPGPSPTKTPGTFEFADGVLLTGNLTEITFPPATKALDVDVTFSVHFGVAPPDDPTPSSAELITFTDDGIRHVTELPEGGGGDRLRFPGVKVVRVAFRATGGATIKLFTVHARTPVSAIAFTDGGGEQFGPFEEVNGIITVVGQALGLIKLGTPRRCEFTIMEICTPDRTLQLNRHTVQSLDLLTEIDPIFEPQADYRMVVTTRRNSSPNPKDSDASQASDKNKLVEQAYFHVVGPPGIEVPDQPVTDPATTGPTGFEDLSFYVASTVPDSTPASDGKPVLPRAYYRSYDVAIYFNQPSAVEQMYRLARRDLTLRLFDTANNPVLDADGRAVVPTSRWDTAQQPTLTDAQARWVGQVNNTSCHPTDIPKFQVSSALTNQNLSAPAELLAAMMDGRYVRDLAHKTHRGLAGQALKGRATGGKIFGYKTTEIGSDRMDPHGKPIIAGYEYTIDDGEKRIVTSIFRMFTEGQGLHRIARSLNDQAAPYPRLGKKNDGGGWSHTTVRSLLRNERYVGKFVWNKTQWLKVPGSRKRQHVPRPQTEWKITERPELAIISPDLWAKAQERIRHVEKCYGERSAGRFVKPANRAAAGSHYLFSGLLRCGTCGGNMTVVAGDKGGIDGRRYGCSKHFNMGSAICSNNLTIRTAVLDATISTEVGERLATPAKLEEAAAIFREELAVALKDVPDREVDLRKALKAAETEAANFVRAIAEGVNARSIADALTAAEAKRESLRAELERLQAVPRPSDVEIHPSAVRELITNVASALRRDVPDGREALRRYLGTITMRPVEDAGSRYYVAEGTLDATEALAGALPETTGSPGRWTRTAYVSVVAGA